MSDPADIRHAGGTHQAPPSVPQDYLAEVDLEYARWSEITALIRVLTPDERLAPGYFREPDWSVKDLVAHIGAWLEEAATQLTNIAARSYVPHDVDIDAQRRRAGRDEAGVLGDAVDARDHGAGVHAAALVRAERPE
jgi:hypothetical protein